MEKTPYNHSGKFNHASVCADAVIKALESQLKSLVIERSLYVKPIMLAGEANRLNDYARELEGLAHNLVHFLEHAGSRS